VADTTTLLRGPGLVIIVDRHLSRLDAKAAELGLAAWHAAEITTVTAAITATTPCPVPCHHEGVAPESVMVAFCQLAVAHPLPRVRFSIRSPAHQAPRLGIEEGGDGASSAIR